jgi:hypothetical protein
MLSCFRKLFIPGIKAYITDSRHHSDIMMEMDEWSCATLDRMVDRTDR